MAKREQSKLEMSLYNISGCDINNLMIDIGNISKELDDDRNCPVKYRYMIKGIYEAVYELRNNTGAKIKEYLKSIEDLNETK